MKRKHEYPVALVPLFTVFAAIGLISLLGLIVAPLYATREIATALLFGLAIGLGGAAWAVAIAARRLKTS